MHHNTIWHFLRKELKRFPYKLQVSTELTEDHKTKGKQFPQHYRRDSRNGNGYLQRIVFSDECKFSFRGKVNKQNCQIWRSERPNEVYEALCNSPSMIAWCALSKNEIIRPSFFKNENTTGSAYKRTLRYFLFPRLRDYPQSMIFQRDGESPYYANEGRQYLDTKIRGRWMKGWIDFLAFTLSTFNPVRLLSVLAIGIYCIPRYFKDVRRANDKNSICNPSYKRRYIAICLQKHENAIKFRCKRTRWTFRLSDKLMRNSNKVTFNAFAIVV